MEVGKFLKGSYWAEEVVEVTLVQTTRWWWWWWSSDELHGLKHLTSLPQCTAVQFNHLLQNSTTEDWMTTGHTFLIIKDHQKGNEPSYYWPITCLPTLFKLLTGLLARSIYNYLIENSLYPTEQKGNFKKLRGTKDQLLIDKMILKSTKRWKTNLNMAWIDYKKKFDSLPHSWINICFKMFGINKTFWGSWGKSWKNGKLS